MSDNGTFCSLPWINLNTTPQGACKLCCNIVDSELVMHGTGPDSASNFLRHTPVGWGIDGLDAIWNGPHMAGVRSDMISGNRRRECSDCYRIESMGMPSPRTEANQRYAGRLPGSLSTRAALPTSLELRLSTRCNLSCTTCWAGSSDTVAREHTEQLARSMLADSHPDHLPMPEWLQKSISREMLSLGSDARYASSDMAVSNFERLAPTLERLYITGGEPTMDANVHDYLQILLDHGNDSCHVSFTTNCTLWNDKLMALVSRFCNAEVQLSIDGHEDGNDWIRHHSAWLDVIANVDRYFSYPNIKLIFYTVISALNALSLDDLLLYLRHTTHRHQRMAVWTPIILQHPRHLATGVLPPGDRLAAAGRLESAFSEPEHPFYYRDGLDRVLTVLRDGRHDGTGFEQLAEFMDHTQNVRSSMLRSFAMQRKIGVDQLEENGYIVPRRWQQVFPTLAGVICKART